jgi:uncharacterized glyoxalase superfamily protein PhnB
MALELFMIGVLVQDMNTSLEFYRLLGVDFPAGSEGKTHIEVKMGELTFFLDSRPNRWDPDFAWSDDPVRLEASAYYPTLLEFYLKTDETVKAKYAELIAAGYRSQRAPYETRFGMCFAMIKDPDGNVVLLSGDLEKNQATPAG